MYSLAKVKPKGDLDQADLATHELFYENMGRSNSSTKIETNTNLHR